MKKNQIKSISTEWGDISLVEAMILLLKDALKNKYLTHFIFLSDHCVPLYDYITTCDTISKFNKSSIHHFGNRRNKGVHHAFKPHFIRHSQWCILKRNDAETIVSQSYTHLFKEVSIPDEIYFGTLLNYYNIEIDNKITTYVNWKNYTKRSKGKSPYLHTYINEKFMKQLTRNNKDALFLRKVDHCCDYTYIQNYCTHKKPNVHIVKFAK